MRSICSPQLPTNRQVGQRDGGSPYPQHMVVRQRFARDLGAKVVNYEQILDGNQQRFRADARVGPLQHTDGDQLVQVRRGQGRPCRLNRHRLPQQEEPYQRVVRCRRGGAPQDNMQI